MRTFLYAALKVRDTHPDNALLRREEAQRKERRIQLPGALAHVARGGIHHHLTPLLVNIKYLNRID